MTLRSIKGLDCSFWARTTASTTSNTWVSTVMSRVKDPAFQTMSWRRSSPTRASETTMATSKTMVPSRKSPNKIRKKLSHVNMPCVTGSIALPPF